MFRSISLGRFVRWGFRAGVGTESLTVLVVVLVQFPIAGVGVCVHICLGDPLFDSKDI
jgi:hypothetical protein